MSLFSLFKKITSLSSSAVSAPEPTEKPGKSAKSKAVNRGLAAAAEEGVLESAIKTGDFQAVARLVVSGASTRIRQSAAEAIEDPEILRQLIREVRGGKDKSVYKVLTAKRDVLLDQARKLEQVQLEINEAIADLERLSQRTHDALYGLRLHQYESRWNALAEQAAPELRAKAQEYIERARTVHAEHVRQVEAQSAREKAAEDAAAEADRLREQRAQESAAASAEQAHADAEQKRALDELQQKQQQIVREISELIRKARAALAGGSSSRAASVRRAIEEKLTENEILPASISSQIQQLDKQLEELKDWKNFSVIPKRAELIEEMESLVGETFDPLILADRIKTLQDQWRTLGKGVGEKAEADDQRFHEAAKKAYLPCSEYFAAQALIRQENLQKREALLNQLAAFEAGINGGQPDWRAVIKILRDTKQEWRQYSVVDRKAGKQQQEQFDTVTAKLQVRLDEEYGRNIREKESLIERAKNLINIEDAKKSVEAAKELQQKWQSVGLMPREADQRLWAEFRKNIDAVFQKRQQQAADLLAALEINKVQAIALCEQIEAISVLEGEELKGRATTLPALQAAFEALGEFPRAETRDLRNRMDRAIGHCEKALAKQRARDAEKSWNDFFEAANKVRVYQLAVARGADEQTLNEMNAGIESYLATIPKWPKGGLNAIKQAISTKPPADLSSNINTLKTLCIRAEILAGLPTPPEDQELRRDYQLQRLVKGMGQNIRVDEKQLDAMALEWTCAGPVEEDVYQSLLQRFRRCWV